CPLLALAEDGADYRTRAESSKTLRFNSFYISRAGRRLERDPARPPRHREKNPLAGRAGKCRPREGRKTQPCRVGTWTTRPSSSSRTLIWQERRLFSCTSKAKSSMS